jgi:hypothetical protein
MGRAVGDLSVLGESRVGKGTDASVTRLLSALQVRERDVPETAAETAALRWNMFHHQH